MDNSPDIFDLSKPRIIFIENRIEKEFHKLDGTRLYRSLFHCLNFTSQTEDLRNKLYSNFGLNSKDSSCPNMFAFFLATIRVYNIPVFLGTPFDINGCKTSNLIGVYLDNPQDRKLLTELTFNTHEKLMDRLLQRN